MWKNRLLLFFSVIQLTGSITSLQAQNLSNFNDNWYFTLSDSPEYSLTSYKPSHWRLLNLPHDWSIEHDFSKDLEECTAFSRGGIGWYSKVFKTPIDENQKCYIIFDGVYNNAEFWLNGMRIGNHPYGYAPVYYDLTNLLAPKGHENRLSVRVDHSRYADSRWYTGSGIYRNVQLLMVDKLHIPVWGTFITTPMVTSDKASVAIQIDIQNDYDIAQKAELITDIFDPNGVFVKRIQSSVEMQAAEKQVIKQSIEIGNPQLWDVDNPHLYTAKTKIDIEGKVLQQ